MRTNMFQETPWEELPPRPRHDDPESRFFLMIDYRISEGTLRSRSREAAYHELFTLMSRRIVDYFMEKHSHELRQGQSQMVAVQDDYLHWNKKVQMGVYILTPQEMDELKAEWLREYQSRQKAHS